MVRQLPQVAGYTVDFRLREFRRVTRGKHPRIEFVSFDSPEGRLLLRKLALER